MRHPQSAKTNQTLPRFATAVLGMALALPAAAEEANSAAALTRAAAPGTQALEIRLPKPLFVGTPKNIKSKNLEKPLPGKRPIYQVPAGTVLLSAGKKVDSSDQAPIIGSLELVTDKDKEGSDTSIVELSPGKQYVQIDLGKPAQLAALVVWHYHQDARVYRDVVVQVAEDPDFITGVSTLFNNDDDNSSGLGAGKDQEYLENYEGKLIDGKGAKGRYVRLFSNGNTSNDANHYIEVEVYGKWPE
ncbi:MAG: hypothetical protein NTW21_10225 [Verrucomicrobia bacterium]|nr:hypothetical protein [Verrucomicrobiota bacterium]